MPTNRMYATYPEHSYIDSGLVYVSGADSNTDVPAPCFFQLPGDDLDPPYVPKDGSGSQCILGDHDILHALKPSSLGWSSQFYPVPDRAPLTGYQAQAHDYPPRSHSPIRLVSPVMEHSAYRRKNDSHRWADHRARAGSLYPSSIGSHLGNVDNVPHTHSPFSSTTSFQDQDRPFRDHTATIQARSSGFHLTEYSDSSGIPDAGSFLRKVLNIPAHIPIHLSSLRDPRDRAGRPPYSIPQLAAVAIYSNPRNKASAAEIRQALMSRFEYFRHNESPLKETLKHALSHHSLFQRAPRARTEPGKGGFWYLDVSNPYGSRPRQRTARHHSSLTKHTETMLDTRASERQRSLPAQVDRETSFSTPSPSYIHDLDIASAYAADSSPFPGSFGGDSYLSLDKIHPI
ncbi:uncharacterized protein EV420DRAFT_449654 [Desarmillaria tabescens]|uniref:Fork-head domain-containing protein n=1 Tax=Armillaria tabescens TaxID=1929756 RepID=A0AA39NM83_ARMTA|nr:uncharacterized protein EV420DRAFT_449654 [Desarmillaria tabescens]KAK0468155.1 hypothetical protein EV420DRAFT_449654 [Desarmillaria tabescens]